MIKENQKHSPSCLPDEHNLDIGRYTCLNCRQEAHWKVLKSPFATKKDKIVWACCECPAEQRRKEQEDNERRMVRNNLDKAYRTNIMNDELTAARFSTFTVRPGTDVIYRETKKFAEEFTPGQVGSIGYGNPGNGKSHLFASIHHHLNDRGYISLFIDCSRLFEIVADAKKFSSKVNIGDIVNGAIGADLLTLDELGCRKISSDEYDVLFTIINGRQGKTTNGTTNLDLDELMQWLAVDKYKQPLDTKGRLIDRILGSCDVIENNGTSFRQEKAMRRLGVS